MESAVASRGALRTESIERASGRSPCPRGLPNGCPSHGSCGSRSRSCHDSTSGRRRSIESDAAACESFAARSRTRAGGAGPDRARCSGCRRPRATSISRALEHRWSLEPVPDVGDELSDSNSERPKEYEGTLVEFFALTCTPFRSFSREPGFHEVRGKSPPYSIWVTVLPFGQVPGLDAERLLAELEKRISALPRGSIDPPSCGAGG